MPHPVGPCQNGAMSDRAAAPEKDSFAPSIRILMYSDDRNVRDSVRVAVGNTLGGRTVRWTEVATHPVVVSAVEEGQYDLLILDGEAAKAGGMGICRQLKHEVRHCPPVLVLVGRRDDAWLATWSEADKMVFHPVDPFEMKAAVEGFVEPAAARND